MDRFVEKEGLKDTFPYLDNITVAGHDQNEHENVKKFREAIQRRNLTLNENKTVESKSSINLLLATVLVMASSPQTKKDSAHSKNFLL